MFDFSALVLFTTA